MKNLMKKRVKRITTKYSLLGYAGNDLILHVLENGSFWRECTSLLRYSHLQKLVEVNIYLHLTSSNLLIVY